MFWYCMTGCNCILPILMIVCGRILWKHCPLLIDNWFGYKTKRSTKNNDTWEFANTYCGRRLWIIGCVILLPSILAMIPAYNATNNTVGITGLIIVAIQIIVCWMVYWLTHMALKNKFNEDGTIK